MVGEHNLWKIVENTIKGADCTSIKINKRVIFIKNPSLEVCQSIIEPIQYKDKVQKETLEKSRQ